MAKLTGANGSAEVSNFIKKMDSSKAALMEAIRLVILKADKQIGEQIKWNAPAFYYTGEMKAFDPKEYKRDIVVFNFHKKDHVLLVFPSGAKIKNTLGILEGDYKDGRRMASILDLKDLKAKEKSLQKVIQEWLTYIEK